MNGLIGWAGAVCMAAAGITALHMLVGKEGTGRVFRLLTAAFFLLTVFSPILTGKGDISSLLEADFQPVTSSPLIDKNRDQLEQATEEILLQTVNTTFHNYDLNAQKVDVKMDNSEDGSISITSITVYLDKADSLQRVWAKQIAEQRLGTEVIIAMED